MRVYIGKVADRFVNKERISDSQLLEIAEQVAEGQFDADLGGGVFKVRVARPGRGKSKGYRFIVLFQHGDRLVFAFAYAKNRISNLSGFELDTYRRLAHEYLHSTVETLQLLLDNGTLRELSTSDD